MLNKQREKIKQHKKLKKLEREKANMDKRIIAVNK